MDATIKQVSRWFAASFVVWCATTQVMGVITTAPVPTFAAPYVPVGPAGGRGTSVGNMILHGGQMAFTAFGG